ncbi:MAG: mannose-1-phosphate guanylyltransferase/mannose-6-phosphate isomerase [Candidatus Marinimicrobia bacterium]|nr:mannose-1-phosphate guanylyltransferase/mannose-6-phosphate isomerase [Candidatus Neomarinimicrobiota bacterium]
MNKMKHVIMCGGSGSRFWPLSTSKMPKQFLKLIGNKSLLRLTVDRLLNISSIENIFLVTSKKYEDLIKSEIPEISEENILYEPSARNTTAAIYYALKTIKSKNNSSVVGVYPADHYIKSEQDFVASVKEAHDLVTKYKERVYTLGIKPNYPSTSYGYIQCDADNENSYKVAQFCEKPDLNTAKKMIELGSYVWNSGMFFFDIQTMLNEINLFVPEMEPLFGGVDIEDFNQIENIWNQIPKISIDYAVMEKTQKAFCIKLDCGWTDLGTWVSLYDLLDKDKDGNVFNGNVFSHKASNNLAIAKNSNIGIVGLDNIAVVEYDNQILVINLSDSESVRKIINQLSDSDK